MKLVIEDQLSLIPKIHPGCFLQANESFSENRVSIHLAHIVALAIEKNTVELGYNVIKGT
jgi:hypothetical protein